MRYTVQIDDHGLTVGHMVSYSWTIITNLVSQSPPLRYDDIYSYRQKNVVLPTHPS